MQKIGWYWNRLSRMSVAEAAHRAGNTVFTQAQRRGLFTAVKSPMPSILKLSASWLSTVPEVDVTYYLKAAHRVLEGDLPIFALENAKLGKIPCWNSDPRTGIAAPLVFGKDLDYRDEQLVGDIKYLWEPNRHLQLVTVAQAYRLTGAKEYLEGLQAQLDSWFEQCPYPRGPNWASSLELAIRLINWSFVWQLTGGLESPLFQGLQGEAFRDRWLRSIYQHAHFIIGHLSRFSSANNHLIGEAAGLFIAGSTWPFWDEIKNWRETGYQILVREALIQNSPDGINREQAIAYQQFVLDFLLIAALTGRANQVEFPQEYWDRIEAMLVYLGSVMDVIGNVPMIGDADDGYVVRLSQEDDFCPYRSLLATGAVLFKRADFKYKAKKLDDKTRWLLGEHAAAEFGGIDIAGTLPLPIRRSFPEGGYYILGSNFETDREIRLIVDAGPLGYLSIAAHGHADALAIILTLGGREFLVDPGTYSYHTQRIWRDYFRGTAAHNTVVVDSQDQSVIGGSFMWLRHAHAECRLWRSDKDVDEFSGLHDGYTRLSDPVIHRRDIYLDKTRDNISIKDIFNCKQLHIIERCWHFSEQCTVSIDGHSIFAENNGIRIRLTSSKLQEVEVIERWGTESPPGGWISRSFDKKYQATSVIWRTQIHGDSLLETEISCFV